MFEAPRVVRELSECDFYHTMDVPSVGLVRGHWDLRGRFADYTGGVDVRGRAVLDIGAATGFLSFEAERLGASRVVSFDMSDVRQQAFVPFADGAPRRDPEGWHLRYSAEINRWKNAYWLCHAALRSEARVHYGDIHDISPELGRFDVVFVGSVLEHLRDPICALESIARVANETLVIVTPVFENDEPIARFEPRLSAPQRDYTWWTWSTGLYRELLGILGFTIERWSTAKYWHEYAKRLEPRTTLVARRKG